MNKLIIPIIAISTIIAACGNDPVTYAGYFDDDQDKSVTTNNNSNGDQVFNNYGSGNMNVTNNTGDTYIQYDASITNTINALRFSYQVRSMDGYLNVTNVSADTLFIKGTFVNNNGYMGHLELSPSSGWMEIPPFETRGCTDWTGGKCVTITHVTFLKKEIDSSVSYYTKYNYITESIWTGAIKLGNCK